jgi:hypothetical protein
MWEAHNTDPMQRICAKVSAALGAMASTEYGMKMSTVKLNKIPLVAETFICHPRKGSKWFKHLKERQYVLDVKLLNTRHHYQHQGWMQFIPKNGVKSALGHGDTENPSNPELLTKTVLEAYLDYNKNVWTY